MSDMEYGDERLPERFWEKVYPEPNTGCWLWSGATLKSRHGMFKWGEVSVLSHRLALSVATQVGLKTSEQSLHLCNNPPCVNPEHLYWGSASNNVYDQVRDKVHHWSTRTECPQKHPYTEANTYRCRDGRRLCLTCKREQDAFRARKARAAKKAANYS